MLCHTCEITAVTACVAAIVPNVRSICSYESASDRVTNGIAGVIVNVSLDVIGILYSAYVALCITHVREYMLGHAGKSAVLYVTYSIAIVVKLMLRLS